MQGKIFIWDNQELARYPEDNLHDGIESDFNINDNVNF